MWDYSNNKSSTNPTMLLRHYVYRLYWGKKYIEFVCGHNLLFEYYIRIVLYMYMKGVLIQGKVQVEDPGRCNFEIENTVKSRYYTLHICPMDTHSHEDDINNNLS